MNRGHLRKMKRIIVLITWLIFLFTSGNAAAADLWVNNTYYDGGTNDGHTWGVDAFNLIQDAVDVAVDDDVIILADGVYTGDGNRDIVTPSGIILTIRSVNGPEATIIDCEKMGIGFHFREGQVRVEGITIKNSWTDENAAAIFHESITYADESLTHINCIFAHNTATLGSAGAVVAWQLFLENCIFRYNKGLGAGAVAFSSLTRPSSINNCFFLKNNSSEGGGAITTSGFWAPSIDDYYPAKTILNSTFIDNSSRDFGGAIFIRDEKFQITNSIFRRNKTKGILNQIYSNRSSLTIRYSNIEGGSAGVAQAENEYSQPSIIQHIHNISTDPLLALPDDPHLMAGSPCIDAGTDDTEIPLLGNDLDGNPRVLPVSTGAVDMGAYEFDETILEPAIAVSPTLFDITTSAEDSGILEFEMQVRNRGGGILNWEISEDCSWLEADPASGESNGNINDITLSIHIDPAAGLIEGENICNLTVEDSLAVASSKTVTFALNATRKIYVSTPDNFDDRFDDFQTIQEAIDSAINGDIVVLRDGTFTGPGNINLDYRGKAITVRSENGPESTIIDCENNGRAFYFNSNEAEDSILEGIQIINGYVESSDTDPRVLERGGAIMVLGSSPTIINCIFRNNSADGWGGAIFLNENSVYRCLFENNTAGRAGGAIYGRGTIKDSVFRENEADWGGAVSGTQFHISNSFFEGNNAQREGGAVFFWLSGSADIESHIYNSIFYNNSSVEKGEAIAASTSDEIYFNSTFGDGSLTLNIINSTIYSNGNQSGSGVDCTRVNGSDTTLFCNVVNSIIWNSNTDQGVNIEDIGVENEIQNDVRDWVHVKNSVFSLISESEPPALNPILENNIRENPGLGPNLKLNSDSPCIDKAIQIDNLFSDYRGSLRPIDGDNDGSSFFDIGAVEYSRFYGEDGEDETTKAFNNLQLEGAGDIPIGYEYKITWDLKNPFPDNDHRVSEPGVYSVRLFLDDRKGRRVDLFTTRKDIDPTGYANGFTFGYQHIGNWHLGMELVSDPDQFLISDEVISIVYGQPASNIIGREITPPVNAFHGLAPDIENENLCAWSEYSRKLYAVAPGVTTVTWYEDVAKEIPIHVIVGNRWPDEPQLHIAGTPPVDLLPEGSIYNSVMMAYSSINGNLTGDEFRMAEAGYSVLYYYNTETEIESFEVIRSVEWNDLNFLEERSWNIGSAIAGTEFGHSSEHNGYVINENARYDGYGSERIHDRDTLTGPIIPVNEDDPATEDDDLAIAWYQTGMSGASWPYQAVRYSAVWPADNSVKNIIIENSMGSGPLLVEDYGLRENMRVYNQPDPDLPGYNPNEEHGLLATSMDGTNYEPALFALRNDLNRHDGNRYTTSAPYVLLKYRTTVSDEWSMEVYRVVVSEEAPAESFRLDGISGQILNAPYPLDTLFFNPCEESGPAPDSGPYFEDKNGELYAKEPDENNPPVLNFSYPLQDGFYYDLNGNGEANAQTGECISWDLLFDGETSPRPVNVTYDVSWPDNIPLLHIAETLMTSKNGLPEINHQCSVELLYGDERVRLIDPLIQRSVDLAELPEDIDFEDLPFHLSERLSYDDMASKLVFQGYFDDSTTGEPLLLLNIMSYDDQDRIKRLSPSYDPENPDDPDDSGDTGDVFLNAVDALAFETRSYMNTSGTGLSSMHVPPENTDYFVAESKALTAGASENTGEVMVAFNNFEDCIGPVDLQVIQVTCQLYTGEIKVIEPENVFDNRVTLRHTGDFGGSPEERLFEWKYWEDGSDIPSDINDWEDWFLDPEDGRGAVEIIVEGPGDKTLSDKWFAVRYQFKNEYGDDVCTEWSEWSAPQLYQGWIKRVLAAINLFDQRIRDFYDYAPNTLASMIQQAGERFEGSAALNYDPDNLDSLGLIEFYHTIFELGMELTINAAPPEYTEASNQQLLLVASRLTDLYMLLGNEAYADAVDPTIGFSTDDGSEYGQAVSSIFCFQNQEASLLDEELSLLRGKDDEGLRPYYNRLVWNFTQTEGEVAYVQTYNIFDWNGDGFINEFDARSYFPQGHGDAWGHYLTAIKTYYSLLKHPEYIWMPRAESLLVAGNPVEVDYEDERRFAKAATAKAKAGADIVNFTFRKEYDETMEGQLEGYKDYNFERAWGVDEWASRAGQGAYFDWIVANAILPAEDPDACSDTNTSADCHDGIQKIDRTTANDLKLIPTYLNEIQMVADRADSGMNPMGLAGDTIPFDIDPTMLEVGSGIQGETHFRQVYTRALEALNNTATVFNHASRNTALLRMQNDSVGDFQVAVEAEEVDFNNRLIEIFGYPYSDDCGPGRTYDSDYCDSGPDLYHYMYVDESELTSLDQQHVQGSQTLQVKLEVPYYSEGHYIHDLLPTRTVEYHLSTTGTNGAFTIAKPTNWAGSRKAPGELQLALSDLLQARGGHQQALDEYDNLITEIEEFITFIEFQFGVNKDQIEVMTTFQADQVKLDEAIKAFHATQIALGLVGETAQLVKDAILEFIPESFSEAAWGAIAARGGIASVAAAITASSNIASEVFGALILSKEQEKEYLTIKSDIDLTRLENKLEFQQSLLELENLMRSEISVRTEVFTLAEALNQCAGQYLAILAEGERLIEERQVFRTLTAADIQSYRYQDMAFRIFRNDALNKYRSQFDMAALYTYLAAKAYDYETGMLESDSRSGKAFLSEIVKQRNIGQVEDGEPLIGSGLADIMKRMWLNYQVIEPQMGFNNPQIETNRFSVRQELFRILPDDSSDDTWQEVLQAHRVDDLWDIPEFRRYCRPFASEGIAQPGLVIPFSTTVTSGLNFFGWPLGGGDSYYSATNIATKVRSVGVWFTGYNNTGMAETPRVYLVPVGTDVLRSPSYDPSALRFFNVVDQKIPVPFPVSETELVNNQDWIPTVDTLYDNLYDIRRHSDFRAYHDSGYRDDSEMTFDTRLVGRSVYNDRWLLIIPGRSLYYDADEGISRFIQGAEVMGSGGERTGDGVTDIKLFFDTYGYSGN